MPVVIGGDNLPSPVGIGLTDLPNIGGPVAPLALPLVPASLDCSVRILTLSGTGEGIFIPLSLLDQVLSVDFFSKFSKLF